MANKQTKRERRELAKKQRLEEMRRTARRRKLRALRTLVTVVVAGALIAFLVVQSGKSNREKGQRLDTLAAAAGCTKVQNPASEGREHINPPQTFQYKTNPPTSGNHYGSPGTTGLHLTLIQSETQVHNLEHGHIGIQYKEGALSPETQSALEELARKDDTIVFVAPKPDLTSTLAFSAWTRFSTCDTPKATADVTKFAEEFVKRFKGKGPENVPGTPER